MRIWDQMEPQDLCRQHLLAQWREGLGLWNVLTLGKKGYANHPETKRWIGFERALWNVLARTRSAMLLRGWNPKPLPDYSTEILTQRPAFRFDESSWPKMWDDQIAVLKAKMCQCKVPS